jgi:hypothetical protein
VSELLASTIREKYHQEREEADSQAIAQQHESMANQYSNPHAREVMISASQSSTKRSA